MLSATVPYPPLPSHPAMVNAWEAGQQDVPDTGQPNARDAGQPPRADLNGLVGERSRGTPADSSGRSTLSRGAARAVSVAVPNSERVADRAPRQRLWAWARLLGGAAILGLVLWRVGTAAFLDGLRVLDGTTLAVAFGIGLLTTVCSAWRWCLVARGLGIRLPLASAVADYYRALFLNAALPGGVLGDVHRAVRHGRDVGDVGRGVRAVVLERTAGQLVLITVSVVVLLTHPLVLRAGLDVVADMSAGVGTATVLTVAALVAGGLGVAVVTRRRRGRHGSRSDRDGSRSDRDGSRSDRDGSRSDRGGSCSDRDGSRWAAAVRTTVTDVRRGLLTRGNWPWIALASALALAGHLATFVVAARTAGASAPVGLLVPLMLLALLAMTLPLNVGGWGPREGVCAWAFGAAGLSAAQGLTVAVVYGLFAFVASLPGAGVLLVNWAAARRQRRRPGVAAALDQSASNRSDSA